MSFGAHYKGDVSEVIMGHETSLMIEHSEPCTWIATTDISNPTHTEIVFAAPLPFTEKTDIEIRAVGSSSNSALHVSAALDIVYIKNDSRL